MTPYRLSLAVFILCHSLICHAVPKESLPSKSEKAPQGSAAGSGVLTANPLSDEDAAALEKPVLSSEGIQRMSENLTILTDNIDLTAKNFEAAMNNVKIVQTELSDLDKLESEHTQLAKQYDSYLEKSDKELQKNDEAARALEKKVKDLTGGGAFSKQASPETTQALQKAQTERQDRDRWRADTVQKMQKIHELRLKLATNVRDIQSRRGPLHAEEKTWSDRVKEYETLLAELKQKKANLEKVTKK